MTIIILYQLDNEPNDNTHTFYCFLRQISSLASEKQNRRTCHSSRPQRAQRLTEILSSRNPISIELLFDESRSLRGSQSSESCERLCHSLFSSETLGESPSWIPLSIIPGWSARFPNSEPVEHGPGLKIGDFSLPRLHVAKTMTLAHRRSNNDRSTGVDRSAFTDISLREAVCTRCHYWTLRAPPFF